MERVVLLGKLKAMAISVLTVFLGSVFFLIVARICDLITDYFPVLRRF